MQTNEVVSLHLPKIAQALQRFAQFGWAKASQQMNIIKLQQLLLATNWLEDREFKSNEGAISEEETTKACMPWQTIL